MSVVTEYRIQARGPGRLTVQQVRSLLNSLGCEMVSFRRGLVCGECHGNGKVIRTGHQGCIVMPTDYVPCPSKCDNGRATDEERLRAIRAREV